MVIHTFDSNDSQVDSRPKSRVDLRVLLNPEKILFPFCERRDEQAVSPFSIELHLSSFCNYNCYHCSYQRRRARRLIVGEEKIETLIEDIVSSGVKGGVYWSGGGEPTTIKNIKEYIKKIADAGIEQSLITNAMLIDDNLVYQLNRLSYIAISLQASTGETYKKITGYDTRDKFYRIVQKLRKALEGPIFGARCVINKCNYKEIEQIYYDSRRLGFDYIIFIPAIDYEKRGDVELTNEEKNFLKKKVENMLPYLDDSFTNLVEVVNRNVSYYKDERTGGYPCYANNIRATAFVNYDGGVWLCQPHIGNPLYCIGNIYERRLSGIWNSKRHRETIALLDAEHKAGMCKNCRSIAYNRVIHKFILTGEGKRFYDPFL